MSEISDEALNEIRNLLASAKPVPDALSVGFFNDAATERLEKTIVNAGIAIRQKAKERKLDEREELKKIDKSIITSADKTAKAVEKSVKKQEEAMQKYGGKFASAFSQFKELKEIFSTGNEFSKSLFLASKAFEVGTFMLKKAFQASMTYVDRAKDLSDAGLMIGTSANMIYRTVEGAYDRFSDGTADFNDIITHSANLAGIQLEDFSEKLKENSSFLVRMYAAGIEGTAEIGNLYATAIKRAGDMSQRNTDTVVKHWTTALQPFYTTEEYIAKQLDGSFGNLVETMNYFMKATGKSAENLLKENEIKEKTLALEKITAENPQIVSSLKAVGYSDEMIMGALTGRVTKELNMQLMNSPAFARGFANVQAMIRQHATDGYLNTAEGRELFAKTVLNSVNMAKGDKSTSLKTTDMLTRFSYAPYEFIRQIEAVGRINTDALDLNATVRGQNSSQTALVESSNEANRDINEIKNNITNTISPEMENLSGIYKILSHVTGVGANITGVVSSNPLLNKIVGGAWSIGGPALIAYGAIKGAKMMYGLARGVMGATGAGAGATATGAGATATGAGAAAGILPKVLKFGGGVLGGISGAYNVYDGIKNWDSNGSTLNKGLRIGQIGTGIAALAALLAAPFTGGTSLLPLVGALGLGSGLLGLGADATAGSKLEESAKRGASEEQPNYFTSPEIVNKLTQIQVICQSLYGVACMNKQANTFARMDTVSASYK